MLIINHYFIKVSFTLLLYFLLKVPVSPAETATAMQPNISHMTNQLAQMHMHGGNHYIIPGGYPANAHQNSWQLSQQTHQQSQIQVLS